MSNQSFRAITTRYKGYNFRSRLEARWAVFFDHLGIRWDYEPEGFELGNGLRYLPDFWLPDLKVWVEIKPGELDDAAREKGWRLALNHEHVVYVSNGMPDGVGKLLVSHTQNGGEVGLWEFDAIVMWHKASWRGPTFIIPSDQTSADDLEILDQDISKIKLMAHPVPGLNFAKNLALIASSDALDAARSARFEFGAKGAVR